MASIGENLHTFLSASTGVAAATTSSMTRAHAIEQNAITEPLILPKVWYQRASETEERDLSGAGGIIESRWDIEIYSEDIDEALAIGDAIKRVLNGHRGTFGTGTSLGAEVSDHDDDYVLKGLSSDEGAHVAALSATLFFNST